MYIYVYTRPSQLSDGIRQQLAKYAWQLTVAMFTKPSQEFQSRPTNIPEQQTKASTAQ